MLNCVKGEEKKKERKEEQEKKRGRIRIILRLKVKQQKLFFKKMQNIKKNVFYKTLDKIQLRMISFFFLIPPLIYNDLTSCLHYYKKEKK